SVMLKDGISGKEFVIAAEDFKARKLDIPNGFYRLTKNPEVNPVEVPEAPCHYDSSQAASWESGYEAGYFAALKELSDAAT
ncbi:hypothetical protein NL464_27215, partial [Klebsiella pneumoniae]|nr:hypothetical protein [Klebsiella pneumoniae]